MTPLTSNHHNPSNGVHLESKMNLNDVNSLLIEAQCMAELCTDDVYQEHDKLFDLRDAQWCVVELIQRARAILSGRGDESPEISKDSLELMARLETDAAIDNAQYMAKGTSK